MTKDSYFEMCEMLGEEPIEAEIPLELSDLPEIVQQCIVMFGVVSDRWDSMGGNYLGKDYSILFNLFDIYQVSDPSEKLLSLEFLQHVDNVRSKLISDKIKAK